MNNTSDFKEANTYSKHYCVIPKIQVYTTLGNKKDKLMRQKGNISKTFCIRKIHEIWQPSMLNFILAEIKLIKFMKEY